MTDQLGFGILGSGNMARVYGDALTTRGRPNGRLVAIAMGSRAEASRPPSTASTPSRSAEALLARKDVDVVVIATPHSTHLAACHGSGRGRQARLPREADGPRRRRVRRDHRRLPRGAGVQLTVAKQTRHMEMSMRAKEYIDEGRIGDSSSCGR